jgi:glycosyltransferase involved in cell wall biosynthesis
VSFLTQVTPVLLTWNEEPNIGRVLDRLTWARDIVIVDSGSSDRTLEVLAAYPNVRVVTRAFTSHEEQWNHAIEATGVATPWILTLDADYVLSEALVQEIDALDPGPANTTSGYVARFVYMSLGRRLRGSLYPPRAVLMRRGSGRFVQEGHTQRLVLDGTVSRLRVPILHDDRKSLGRWVINQERYAALEARRLIEASTRTLGWPDRVRRGGLLAPILVAGYCLIVKQCALDGRAGLYYTFQRVVAECLLAMRLLEIRTGPRAR